MFSQDGVKVIDSVFKKLDEVMSNLNKGIELCTVKKLENMEKISNLEAENIIQDSVQGKAQKLVSKLKELLS
jgi:hypothetical protein